MNILKRLHHRSPYLFIDEVLHYSADELLAKHIVKPDSYFIRGHFPGAPVVPGAVMQEMTTQAAGLLIAEFYSPVEDYDSEKTQGHALGVLRAIHAAKYKSFARPHDQLLIQVKLIDQLDTNFRFKARITKDDTLIMYNEFSLINTDDQKIKGLVN